MGITKLKICSLVTKQSDASRTYFARQTVMRRQTRRPSGFVTNSDQTCITHQVMQLQSQNVGPANSELLFRKLEIEELTGITSRTTDIIFSIVNAYQLLLLITSSRTLTIWVNSTFTAPHFLTRCRFEFQIQRGQLDCCGRRRSYWRHT